MALKSEHKAGRQAGEARRGGKGTGAYMRELLLLRPGT